MSTRKLPTKLVASIDKLNGKKLPSEKEFEVFFNQAVRLNKDVFEDIWNDEKKRKKFYSLPVTSRTGFFGKEFVQLIVGFYNVVTLMEKNTSTLASITYQLTKFGRTQTEVAKILCDGLGKRIRRSWVSKLVSVGEAISKNPSLAVITDVEKIYLLEQMSDETKARSLNVRDDKVLLNDKDLNKVPRKFVKEVIFEHKFKGQPKNYDAKNFNGLLSEIFVKIELCESIKTPRVASLDNAMRKLAIEINNHFGAGQKAA